MSADERPYVEEDLLPLSALQHLLFCERQCALIHIEQVWTENLFTAQGRVMHERVDQGGRESRKNIRLEFGVPLRSLRLGLSGKADMVEFHKQEDGSWLPYPVEYKRGKPKKDDWDRVQLCAQALCLEEMLGCTIASGALFYGRNRRRQAVNFDDRLRRETEKTAERLHELVRSGRTPPARYEKKCDSCSLKNLCMPKTAGAGKNVGKYLSRMLAETK
ncbi:MAG: CRISPR-associated protein Cas4 [Desulfobulbaceae bacterium]|nr:CRISPR-associated protein Cas4 [Desulfobulbaceae bacterium]